MSFVWLRLRTAWFVWATLTLSTHAVGQETADWTQDAVLHNGHHLVVRLQGNSAPQPFYLSHEKSKLSQFRLAFEHPDTQQTITWQGARYFEPLLLDVVDSVAYLVVYGRSTQDTVAQYGCPELPYIYLRHDASGWQPFPVEQAPAVLRRANLSTHGITADNAGRHLSAPDVAAQLDRQARETRGLVPTIIPRTLDHWNTDEKTSAITDRVVGDCRPPRPPLAALVLPLPVQANTSVIESSEYVPEKALDTVDWNVLMTDPQRTQTCKPLFQRTVLENLQVDLHFTHGKTSGQRVPYARNGVLESGVEVLCDTHIWFIEHPVGSKKMVITQYTRTGDRVFRTAFVPPQDESGLTGAMRLPSLRLDGGHLYFDWMLWRTQGTLNLLKRSQSVRVPVSQPKR